MTDDTRQRAPAGGKPPIPAELLCQVGGALYGDQWVTPLARALGVDPDTVFRWKKEAAQPGRGTRVTPRIAPELLEMIEARREQLEDMADRLRPFLGD